MSYNLHFSHEINIIYVIPTPQFSKDIPKDLDLAHF